MDRIQQLEQYATKEYFAYKAREDGNQLTHHEFKREGGGRVLLFCKWNISAVESLSDEEFKKKLFFVKALHDLEEHYKGMTLFEFLTSFNTKD
jgi:hypothetical protein